MADTRSGSLSTTCVGWDRGTFSFSFTPNDWSDVPDSVTIKETKAGYVKYPTNVYQEVFIPVDTQVPLTAVKDENGILQVTAEAVTIDNKVKPLSVTVIKQWRTQEGVDLPESLDVTFYATMLGWTYQVIDAQKVSLTQTNGWQQTIDGIYPKKVGTYYGRDMIYYRTVWNNWVVKEDLPKGWVQAGDVQLTTEVEDDRIHYTLVLVNARDDSEYDTTVGGRKEWQRPDSSTEAPLPESVTFTATAQETGVSYDTKVLAADQLLKDEWPYQITVPATYAVDDTYKPLTYTFSEALGDVDFAYDGAWTQIGSAASSDGGMDFVNRWQEKVTLKLVKEWDDTDASQRPESVTLRVTGGGTDETVTLSALLGWEAELTDLPRWSYDDDGNATEIVYTVT